MKKLFQLTPEAKVDLRDILLDIADDSPETAERLREEFYEALLTWWSTPGSRGLFRSLL